MNIAKDIYYIKLARDIESFLYDNKIIHWPIDLDYDYDRNRADVTIEIKKDKLDVHEKSKMLSTILANLKYQLLGLGLIEGILYGDLKIVPMENENSITFHICFIC